MLLNIILHLTMLSKTLATNMKFRTLVQDISDVFRSFMLYLFMCFADKFTLYYFSTDV